MRVHLSAVLAIVAFTLAATPARAQRVPAFTVTPFVGMGTDGASPVSAAIQSPITSNLSVETDAAYRRGEGKIHAPSANASVLYSLPRLGRMTPYAAVGVGVARYGEVVTFMPAAGADLQVGTASRVAATINFGGGITTRLTDRMDFRTDVRYFQASGRQQGDQVRVALGVGFKVGKR